MEKENEIRTLHDSWLNHPMTKAAFRAIDDHEDSFIESMSVDATSPTVTDEQMRFKIIGMKTCRAIRAKLRMKENFSLTTNELNNL